MQDDAQIVTAYLDVLAASPQVTDQSITETLRAAGFAEPFVSQAVQFVPIAFGRALLDGLGIRFSQNYVLLNGEGRLVERGALDSLVVYKTALTAASSRPDVVKAVALRSAETNAINNALNSGSNPADLAMAPVMAFTEAVTQRGAARAQELLQSMLEDIRVENPPAAPQATRKPRWKFW
ncbi:MAG TPA: hypothetical protein VHC20_08200 [Candidatus Paceibacterota bacterium]|nr:hypothetical protein [Candidatus Paceibacterota bacterium]